jgi:hypothetical protein
MTPTSRHHRASSGARHRVTHSAFIGTCDVTRVRRGPFLGVTLHVMRCDAACDTTPCRGAKGNNTALAECQQMIRGLFRDLSG